MQYKCSRGDRIDLIVLKHYGHLNYLNDVISVNKQLLKKSMILEFDETIVLPDFSVTEQHNPSVTQQAKKREPLW